MKQPHKTLLLWVVLIVAFLAIWQFLNPENPQRPDMPYSEFNSLIKAPRDQKHIEEVEIKDREYTFQIKDPNAKGAQQRGRTIGPAEDNAQELLAHGVRVTYQKDEGSPFLTPVLTIVLPMVFVIVMFYLFMRQLQAGGGKAMSFGKSRARLLSESQNKITFSDVAGIDEAKDEVEEIIAFLKDPKKFQRLGGRIPKGVLMMGPPGTGKTLLARAIAGEAGVPFFSISGSDFVEMFVGVGASRVRGLFEQSKKHAPCIIFIDEIDAVGRHRGAGLGGGNDEREQTLNQLLVEMDGFEANEGVILIAATNRPDVLDPALLRPGRFDRQIVVPNPDIEGRTKILQVHMKKVPLAPDVDARVLARGTPGFSGADLANLVNEAALLAARADRKVVTMREFEAAKDKVMMGVERKSMVMSEEEKRMTAFHEAGHAITALECEASDPIHKATIIPRGRALGMVMRLPESDKISYKREKMLADLIVAMGGRVAEELVFGHAKVSSGASSDIQYATKLARAMVTEWGMSPDLGPVQYGDSGHHEPFLGAAHTQRGGMSESTASKVDAEIKKIVSTAHDEATRILTEKRAQLDTLALALLEYETLSGDEIKAVLAGEKLNRPDHDEPKTPTRSSLPSSRKKKEEDAAGESDTTTVH